MARKRKRESLRKKYRISIINEETYDEVNWWRLSLMNIAIFVFIVLTIVGGGTAAVIFFTPARQYVPGYPSVEMQRSIIRSTILADSLENKLALYGKYLNSISTILDGGELPEEMFADTGSAEISPVFMDKIDLDPSEADSIFRAGIEQREKYNLQVFDSNANDEDDELLLYKPLNGVITRSFNPDENHWGVDLAGAPKEKIVSVADGTVIFAEWSVETGYIIQVQHDKNLISVYKHNSALLKQAGNKVKAGEAIAIIGNSGELSSGPHLHMELWKDGNAINPENHIVF